MKNTARIIITTKCLKNCENCSNTKEMLASAMKIKGIPQGYDNYIITGGEPTLYPDRIAKVIRGVPYGSKVYLQTAMWPYYDEEEGIFSSLDGITYSLHKRFTSDDINRFDFFQDWAEKHYKKMNLRLFIEKEEETSVCDVCELMEPRLYSRIVIQAHEPNCPLPINETLFILEEL